MGSSGAFTVCLLKALALARRTSHARRGELAEAACEIEIDVLEEPVGKQDQYVAAHGGICAYTFHPDGTRRRRAARARAGDAATGCATTSCSSTPARRAAASALLADQDRAHATSGDDEMLENLHRTKADRAREPRAARGAATSSATPS